jgi:4'-phosphopantetheinyl transferase EntD
VSPVRKVNMEIKSQLIDSLTNAGEVDHEGVKKVQCGSVKVTLLPPNISISDEQLAKSLHTNEFTRSLSMKSKSRQGEYLRSRYLLHLISKQSHEIINDPSGFILWPQGHIGSLTHKEGLIGCSFESDRTYKGLGVDLEDLAKVHLGLEDRIVQSAEVALFEQMGRLWPELNRETCLALVFSFKESIFKCLYPIGRVFFYFHKAQIVSIDPVRSEIEAVLLDDVSPVTPKGTRMKGHFTFVHDDLRRWVLTSVTLIN